MFKNKAITLTIMITHAQRQVIQVDAAISMVRFLADKQAAKAELHVDSNVVGINPRSDLSSMLIDVRITQKPPKIEELRAYQGFVNLAYNYILQHCDVVPNFRH